MSWKKSDPIRSYEFSAISDEDMTGILSGGSRKHDTFTLGDFNAVCMTVHDDDRYLDRSYKHGSWKHGDVDTNQTGSVQGIGSVGMVETGTLLKLKGSYGGTYDLVQIKTEFGGSYWTFVGGFPAPDEKLWIINSFDHKPVRFEKGFGVQYINASDDSLTTNEDTLRTVNLLTNDCVGVSDSKKKNAPSVDKSDFRIVGIDGGIVGTAFTVTSAAGNELTVTISRNGDITVDPRGNFDSLAVGETDTITLDYTVGAYVTTGKGRKACRELETDEAQVTIIITGLNDAPVAVADRYAGNPTVVVNAANGVLANDNDPDGDTLTASLVSGPANGTVTLNTDGSFTYVPTSLFSGDVQFTYRATDPFNESSTATVTITVPQAAAPQTESYTTDEDSTLTVSAANGVLANDPRSAGDTLRASILTGPENGTLELNEDGSFTYVPDDDFNGSDIFKYVVTDSAGEERESVAEIAVAPVNDAPFFDLDTFRQLPAAGAYSVNKIITTVLAIDVDGDDLQFWLDGPDAFLFRLEDEFLSSTATRVNMIGRETYPDDSPLFPDPNGSALELAGKDEEFDARLFVSDGFEERFLDLTIDVIASS